MKKFAILMALLVALSYGSSVAVFAAGTAQEQVSSSESLRQRKYPKNMEASEIQEAERESAIQTSSRVTIVKQDSSSKSTTPTKGKLLTGTNFYSRTEEEIIELTNQEREANGLAPLTYDVNLHSAARIRSRELCQSDLFFHARPDKRAWNTVLDEDLGVTYVSAGENLSMTEYNDSSIRANQDAQFWVNNWINSPSHHENMLRPNYTHIGVGVYSVEKDGVTYAFATTIFAQDPQ